MPTLNLGIIGCGRISQLVHLGVLTRLPGAELVALAESDADRRAEASRREPSYAPALAHFVNAALHNQRARPDILDGYHSLAVVLAAEESAPSGRTAVTMCLDEDLARR
jgi:predicted dehydrogenase